MENGGEVNDGAYAGVLLHVRLTVRTEVVVEEIDFTLVFEGRSCSVQGTGVLAAITVRKAYK